ncbi:MAG: cation diffusion facilitator family transporter [Clostridia bacterium]|nr:cation diffusion facilitator family transporter [Clostridia bacterium]
MDREKAITRTSIVGILANIVLSGLKALVGFLAGSIAIILDAVNNITDAMSSIITIAGIKLSKMRPDANHPFGHGRIEYFSTIIISFIILFAGASSLWESVKKIIHPVVAEYSIYTIIVVVLSVFVKLFLGRYVKKQGEKYNSDALVASGLDALFDALISVSTLVGIAVTLIFDFSIDGIIGAAISAFIIKAGIEMLMESISNVMGHRSDAEVTKAIKATAREIPGVLGAYDLVLHDYGPEMAMGSMHIEIPGDMSATEIHKLAMEVQTKIYEEFHVILTIGIYAIDISDPTIREMHYRIHDICGKFPGVINSHGIFIDVEKKRISFDITIDFSVHDKEAFVEKVKESIDEIYPGYRLQINLDTNYSD